MTITNNQYKRNNSDKASLSGSEEALALDVSHDVLPEFQDTTENELLTNSKIMMVDDEPINIKAVKKHLELIGYCNFVTTTDSTLAVELVRCERPDVILLDIMMPQVNGLEILAKIRSDRELRFIPVIILTAFCDAKTKREALESGATDFLGKPVDPHELAPRVKNVLLVKAHQDHLENRAQQLARDITERTRELLESRQQAEHRYLAGKAEIATEVLHNVGNALHSVNVSTSVIQSTLQFSKLPGLEKTAALIEQHPDDLASFLTNDSRGQIVPSYLVELAENLSEERENLLTELSTMAKHLDHIKAIVSTQQKYAGAPSINDRISLPALLADADELSGISNGKYGIQIARQFAELPHVVTDKQKLLQILVNVLRNAVASIQQVHSSGGGIITQRLSATNANQICIEVLDNGVGIEPDDLVKIFSNGFTTRKDGHGFGLHSCANIAKELGGTIHARSGGPNCGASFTIELPLNRTLEE